MATSHDAETDIPFHESVSAIGSPWRADIPVPGEVTRRRPTGRNGIAAPITTNFEGTST